MPTDVYIPCPCGSGKKLKFCCKDLADDMERVQRLMDDHQYLQAQAQLRKLNDKFPHNPWVLSHYVPMLCVSQQYEEGRQLLVEAVQKLPHNPLLNIVLAEVSLLLDGWQAPREWVERGLLAAARHRSSAMVTLCRRLAELAELDEHWLAARQYLVTGVRYAHDADREQLVAHLTELDHLVSLPYPLRGTQRVPALEDLEDPLLMEAGRAALRYLNAACFERAAAQLEPLQQQGGSRAAYWRLLGLLRAWARRETEAAQALHRAAELTSDAELAVECELLAQTLDWYQELDQLAPPAVYTAEVDSLGKWLSWLKQQPDASVNERQTAEEKQHSPVVAEIELLDRPIPTSTRGLSVADAPRLVASMVLLEKTTDQAAPRLHVQVSDETGAGWSTWQQRVQEQLGSHTLSKLEPALERMSRQHKMSLAFLPRFPARALPPQVRRAVLTAEFQDTLQRSWWDTPRSWFQGRTWREEAQQNPTSTPGRAAAYLVDALAQALQISWPHAEVFTHLGLQPLPKRPRAPEEALAALTTFQLLHLDLESLLGQDLEIVAYRAVMLGHSALMYRTLSKLLKQPSHPEERLSREPLYRAFLPLVLESDHAEGLLAWLEHLHREPFYKALNPENRLMWEMQELALRVQLPDPTPAQNFHRDLITHYRARHPQVVPLLDQLLRHHGIEPATIMVPEQSTTATSGEIWTPEQSTPTAQSGKLWVPE